jgi:class 3 adenylate cyclase
VSDLRDGEPGSSKHCSQCGASLTRTCSKCGSQNLAPSKFCNECGTSLAGEGSRSSQSSAAAPAAQDPSVGDGERKTITVLFADIQGSMDLLESLDPEDARRLVDPALEIMVEVVRRFDGRVVQSTGDGIFALFGAPIAHGDDPQRASTRRSNSRTESDATLTLCASRAACRSSCGLA